MVIIISPRTARRYLRDINDPLQQFRTCDGQTLKNLMDLACYLKACEEEAFKYHVGRGHNHFSNWVDHVILDKDLATEISLVVDRNPMRIMVTKRINILVFHATRRPNGREKARMILDNAQLPEEHFAASDGRAIRNLWELGEFLAASQDRDFSYHCSPARNDFAEWVGEVLLDFELAQLMMGVRDRKEMARLVGERVSQLEAFGSHKSRGHSLETYVNHVRSWPMHA